MELKINGVTVGGLKNTAKLLLVFMTLLGGQIIFGTPVFGITNSSISISATNLQPMTMDAGLFNSTSQTITVTTDNYTGYNLTMLVTGNTADLINVSDSSLVVPTITLPQGSTSITQNDFNNEYGFSTNSTDYYPVSSSSSGTLLKTTNAAGTSNTTLTFGAMVDSSVPPGTYQNTLVIAALANNPQYSITFNANAGTDSVSNMPSNVGVTVSPSGTITLPSDTPVRNGYNFLGWDTDNTVTSDPAYQPSDTIDLEPTQANAITLYAIWNSQSRIIHDTTTTVYSPSAVPAGYTVYFDNPNIEGNPVVTADDNGDIISFEYTNLGTTGISFTTGHTLDTGIEAFDGQGFTIHLKLTMNSNRNNGKYLVSAIKQLNNSNQYAGFNFYCGSNTYFYLNASQSSTISSTAFGSRINSSGWRVQSNREQTYTLDIIYTPAPNKSISATFTPVSSGSSSFYTDSTNLNYIPDNLDGATISLSGDGLTGDSSKDLSQATILEFSVTKP